MSFALTGKAWNIAALRSYLIDTDLSWAKSVTMHHTGFPDLSMRSKGLLVQHIKNIRHYYEKEKGWSSGPHLFIDDHDINPMTPLSQRGVHARSFNSNSIGIEVLGNYDSEDPRSGRGLKCWRLAALSVAAILSEMGVQANQSTILFHRDDPKTRKSCPGRKVNKPWFIAMVSNYMTGDVPEPQEEKEKSDKEEAIDWQIQSILNENQNMEPDQFGELKTRLAYIRWQALKS